MAPIRYVETGVLYCGDNLRRLQELPAECIDLVYLDPPFFSNRRYEVIWGDEAEVRSFEDRWEGGIRRYIGWMRDRVVEMHRVLRPTGSLYLHCDPNASHYLKAMLDDVFDSAGGGFRTEIVWKRSSAHSDVRQGRRQHGRIHDIVLFYTKSADWTWNPIFTPYDQEYIDAFYRHVEPGTGRRYRLGDLTGPGGASKGNPRYELMGVTRYWRYSEQRMGELVSQGRIVQTKPGAVPQYKRYLDEMPGVPLQDLWTDIPPVSARGREREGYPTQKPEALLERIIRSSSDPGHIVLDPFCGCGTSIAVAQRLRREWIGIDISPQAVRIMKRRVDSHGANARVEGMPQTIEDLRELGPFEFQDWVIWRVNGVDSARRSRDMGIDGYSFFERLPIQIKQSSRVGRKVVDEFQTAISRAEKHMGFIVAFSFTKDAIEEAERTKTADGPSVALVKVSDILRAGELVDIAKHQHRRPDLSWGTRELIHLMSPEQREEADLPAAGTSRKETKPSPETLIQSARATKRRRRTSG